MIYLTMIALLVALVVYALCSRLSMLPRALISAAVLIVPIAFMVTWLMINGDRAPAGAITIYPAEPNVKAKS